MAPPADLGTRAEVILDAGWRVLSHRRGSGPDKGPASRRVSFMLPADRVGAGSALVLEGLRGRATVTVNDHALPPVLGGNPPLEVVVGPWLRPGKNTLVVDLAALDSTAPMLTAQKSADVHWRLGAHPTLILRPEQHVRSLALSLADGQVTATASVAAAPPGSTVHFSAVLDGAVIQELGEAPVIDGTAQAPPARWRGPLWGRHDTVDLVHAVAELRDSAGNALDRASWRTGVREFGLAEGALMLNGDASPLLGFRIWYGDPVVGQLALLPRAGLNAIEVHGDPLDRRTLELTDELGVAVAVVPRCDGRVQAHAAKIEQHLAILSDQDARMLAAAAPHPSLLVWVQEGDAQAASALGDHTAADLIPRVMVGRDLPGAAWPILPSGAPEPKGPGEPFWIVETAGARTGSGHGAAVAQAVGGALAKGAVGGVVPGPVRLRDAQPWLDTVAPELASVAGTLGVPPLPDGRRASAHVLVQGVPSGQIAWLEVPGTTPRGVLSAGAELTLSAWHDGPATVRVGDGRWPAALKPGVWRGFEDTGTPAQVVVDTVPGAGG